jgi:hypothetical protein
MPIVPSTPTLRVEQSAVTLALYAQVVQNLPENIFWGVSRTNDPDFDCDTYVIKPERDSISSALWEAQIEIEQEAGFPMLRRWIADEQRPYSFPLQADNAWVFDGGIRSTTTIETDAAVTHVADDANGNPQDSTVTVATTITDVDEIRVFYPASLGVEGPVEIDPSDIDADGVNATISIPRWRLVAPEFVNNPRGGILYDTVTNFLSVVDVVRVFNDNSTEATIVWPHQSSACSNISRLCCLTCGEFTRTACIYVSNPELGQIDVLPATFSGGSWTVNRRCACRGGTHAIINYRAGPATLSPQARDAIIRLAHTKMPDEPCGCPVFQRMWNRDRTITTPITKEVRNCRFGLMDGAWTGWQFSQAMKVTRPMIL